MGYVPAIVVVVEAVTAGLVEVEVVVATVDVKVVVAVAVTTQEQALLYREGSLLHPEMA